MFKNFKFCSLFFLFFLQINANVARAQEAASQSNTLKVKSVELTPEEPIVEGTASIAVSDDFFVRNNRWTVTYFGITSAETHQIDMGQRGIGSYNYIGLNHRIATDTQFSIRIPFTYDTDGINKYAEHQNGKLALSDIILDYSDFKLASLGAVEVSGNFKLYLPTSQYTQNTHTIARIHPEAYMTLPFGRYSYVTYAFKPDYYWQSQTAFYDNTTAIFPDGSFVIDPRRTNKIASLQHYVELTLDINKYFSSKTSFGFAEDWYYGSSVEGLDGGHATYGTVSAGLEIRPLRMLRFILSLENRPALNRNKYGDSVAYFRPKDNSVVLQTNALLF